MKKLIVLSAVAISSLVFSRSANAQVRFNVNINLGAALPSWISYSNTPDADYYYLPDADCYYSVQDRMYVYRDGGNWRRAQEMPGRFKNVDFRNRRVIGMRGQDAPFMQHNENRNAFNNGNAPFHNDNNRFNRQPDRASDRQPQHGDDNRGNNGNHGNNGNSNGYNGNNGFGRRS